MSVAASRPAAALQRVDPQRHSRGSHEAAACSLSEARIACGERAPTDHVVDGSRDGTLCRVAAATAAGAGRDAARAAPGAGRTGLDFPGRDPADRASPAGDRGAGLRTGHVLCRVPPLAAAQDAGHLVFGSLLPRGRGRPRAPDIRGGVRLSSGREHAQRRARALAGPVQRHLRAGADGLGQRPREWDR